MIDLLRWVHRERPKVLMLGPFWSAIGAGFVYITEENRAALTPSGISELELGGSAHGR